MFTLEQLGALKGGRIDVGFGRLRFYDDQLVREALVEEKRSTGGRACACRTQAASNARRHSAGDVDCLSEHAAA